MPVVGQGLGTQGTPSAPCGFPRATNALRDDYVDSGPISGQKNKVLGPCELHHESIDRRPRNHQKTVHVQRGMKSPQAMILLS